MPRRRIVLEDETDRWRYRCPRGHTNWEPTNQHFWCQQCATGVDRAADPSFEALRDSKTDDLLDRDEVELVDYEDHLRHVGGD
jgi:hypothetical protein